MPRSGYRMRNSVSLTRPADYGLARSTFKDDCVAALQHAFGWNDVERHNKCITVGERSTTLPADVVPCTTLRRYVSVSVHHEGIRIVPDRGGETINWLQQDYENGANKNTRTSRRYKRTVRGLKALKNLLTAERVRRDAYMARGVLDLQRPRLRVLQP